MSTRPTPNHSLMVGSVTALVVGLTGCGGDPASSGATPSAAASSSSPTPSAPSSTRADAASAAQKSFALWARRDVSYTTWWHDLEPLLSPAGRAAYANTDPTLIPPLRITGPGVLAAKAPDDPDLSATVSIPTDKGRFGLFMTRTDRHGPWQLFRIDFPAGLG